MSLEVSVVMPVRNAEKFVRLAVLSTLMALPKSSELILVNDGSTDRTLARISSITDDRLRIIDGPGRGLVSALNFGLSLARGRYVARMDADDVCFPWRFSAQIRRMKANPSLDILFSTALAFGRPMLPFYAVPQLPWSLNSIEFGQVLARRNPAVHPTMFAKRLVLEALDGYHDCPAEDEELWIRASLQKYKLARSFLPTIGLRLHRGQTTRQETWKNSQEIDLLVPALRNQLAKSLEEPSSVKSPFFRALDFMETNGFSSLSILARNLWIVFFRQ